MEVQVFEILHEFYVVHGVYALPIRNIVNEYKLKVMHFFEIWGKCITFYNELCSGR